MTNKQYPALLQFFGCYFHQDWKDEFASPDAAIEAFAKLETLQSVNAAENELRNIVDAMHTSAEALEILNGLGCYYDPTTNGKSALDWLNEIKRRFSELGKTRS